MTLTDTAQADPSTTRLLGLATTGDREAWEAIVSRYDRLVWAVVRAHGFDDSQAADVVQTTWLRLVDHIDRIREPEAASAWLATTARRESWRVLRRARRERPIDDDRPFEAARQDVVDDDPEERALSAETRRMVSRCVNELPERCRALLQALMTDPPPTYNEVSALLHMPVGSIGPTRGRCLQSVQRSLERLGWQQ
jgi:RNA polymerase sigma factor (sigma-70 family)